MIGIYKIENKINGKIYVGQSIDIHKRWKYHQNRLRIKQHPNIYLQSSFDKYGEVNFEYIVLEECSREELHKRENYWCKKYLCNERGKGYNLALTTDTKKYTLSEESKRKIGKAHKGMKHSSESIKLISEANRGKVLSEETKSKMSKSKIGVKFSDTAKQNMSIGKKDQLFKNPLSNNSNWLNSKLKAVHSCNIKTKEIRSYESIKIASVDSDIEATNIVACCRGRKYLTPKNLCIWSYNKEELLEKLEKIPYKILKKY